MDRAQPLLPVAFGKTEKRTHDYVRAGTIDMYAAIDVRTGEVITSLSPTRMRHRIFSSEIDDVTRQAA